MVVNFWVLQFKIIYEQLHCSLLFLVNFTFLWGVHFEVKLEYWAGYSIQDLGQDLSSHLWFIKDERVLDNLCRIRLGKEFLKGFKTLQHWMEVKYYKLLTNFWSVNLNIIFSHISTLRTLLQSVKTIIAGHLNMFQQVEQVTF